ncbi:Bacterioferritin [invertebrate metagenome]|uniref:Bacterioferritin n=1 Tax=invertebrate metagenome TaxID=1711999 RepID=A0A484HA97_9ZZZZ
MQGSQAIVTHLNRILRNELTAINQYFLHAKMLKNWGLNKLSEHEQKESIEEMHHASEVIERILFLEGLPNLQDLGKLLIGETAHEVLANDLTLERAAREDLIVTVAECERTPDYVSRLLLQNILNETEEHIDYLETQIRLAEDVGLQNYLQSQI